jgi:hypothetical protein
MKTSTVEISAQFLDKACSISALCKLVLRRSSAMRRNMWTSKLLIANWPLL